MGQSIRAKEDRLIKSIQAFRVTGSIGGGNYYRLNGELSKGTQKRLDSIINQAIALDNARRVK